MAKQTEPKKTNSNQEKVENIDSENDQLSTFDVVRLMIDAYSEEGNDSLIPNFHNELQKFLKQEFQNSGLSKKYDILVLFDDSTMLKSDADKIYNAVTKFKKDKPVLLILYSGGGVPGSAYLIGKLCREYSNGEFVIVVPRYAKSAATLLCCAANEIHMGSLSELGPIDPQINGMPALGLKNSIEHIAELVTENPTSSDMFAKYLQLSIEPIQIGYYERVAESAMQYAENLLSTHKENLPKSPNVIANELVYKYKDHGFVIDKSEAIKILGEDVIKSNTKEYELGNLFYQFFDTLSRIAGYLGYNFYFIGGLDSEPTMHQKKS
ncbi:SDH family Clp fold serine proteinase [Flagellimonas beolgyonensis]|uniref:SDH family Clp fold serine proteinase n=1 Tax=Flagellimonas beolgyonensis TaxID=864064 RepID=UPI003D65AB13